MRHIKEYIEPNLTKMVLEATFTSDGWPHRGLYDYPVMVMNDILKGKEIALGKEGKDGILKLANVDSVDLDAMRALLAKVENPATQKKTSYKDFDNCFKTKRAKSRWQEIYKGAYTGPRIKTQDQERGTVAVWNAYVDYINNTEKEVNKFDINDLEQVKAIVADINELFKNTNQKAWLLSFQRQVSAIVNYLGIDNAKLYRATRYDEGAFGKRYAKMVQNYSNLVAGESVQKDNYDPTDIILYMPDHEHDIDSLMTCTDTEKTLREYRKIINNKYIIGISLKKVTNETGKAEEYNFGEEQDKIKISSFSISKHEKGNSCTIFADGEFNFKGIMVDPENDEKPYVTKKMALQMRTFGDPIGMDCKEVEGKSLGISLGKSPTRIWTSYTGDKKTTSDNIENQVNAMVNFINNSPESEAKGAVVNMISMAIKCGAFSFPFVIVH